MNFRPSEADRGCCSYREGAVEVEVEDNRVVKTKDVENTEREKRKEGGREEVTPGVWKRQKKEGRRRVVSSAVVRKTGRFTLVLLGSGFRYRCRKLLAQS